jgi:TorA maturation chaperone TorD
MIHFQEVSILETTNSSVSGIYGMLATFFAAEPNRDLLTQLQSPALLDLFKELDIDLGESFYTKDEETLLEELAVEFTSLFIGPGHFISPHESVHHIRDDGDYGRLWGADTVAVKKIIEATGLSYQIEFGGMPDHIAAELEFMQKLEERYTQAKEESETDLAQNLIQIKSRFLDEHLLAWAPEFCEKVMENANFPFYREIARVARDFLQQEGELLDQSIAKCATV